MASLSAEAPSIGFAAALPGLGSLSSSESSGSSDAREINRFGVIICCIMLEMKTCTRLSGRHPVVRGSSELCRRQKRLVGLVLLVGGHRAAGTRPSVPPPPSVYSVAMSKD